MKHILNILILLLVLDAAGVGGLWYGYSRTLDSKIKETELRDEINQEGQKGKKLLQLRQTLASVGKQHDELNKFLIDPSDENQIPLLNSFELLGATTTGATVEISRFDMVESAPRSIHADASLKGSWKQIHHFLRLIEEYPSRVAIQKFDAHLDVSAIPKTGKNTYDMWGGSISFDLVSLKQ